MAPAMPHDNNTHKCLADEKQKEALNFLAALGNSLIPRPQTALERARTPDKTFQGHFVCLVGVCKRPGKGF